ncbi:MAG: hypothetical protein QXL67_01755 [Candidatus Bathyarchaeia archaeon]
MAQICQFCLVSGILCSKCQEKLDSGEVTQLDLKIARLLLSMENEFPVLQNITLYGVVNADETLAIVVGKGDIARMLSYGGKIIKEIGEKTGKTIRVLEHSVSPRKFIEDLFAPLNVVAINKIWLPDGTTETRVILNGKSKKSLSKQKVKALKEIAKKVQGLTLRVEYSS